MTPTDLSALRALEAKATPAPWEDAGDGIGHALSEPPWYVEVVGLKTEGRAYMQYETLVLSGDDTRLIVAARNALPSLLAHVAAQAERIEALEALLDSEHATLTKVRLNGVFNIDESIEASRSWHAAEDDLRARRVLGGEEGT